jgi:predicted Zn-dependent protease
VTQSRPADSFHLQAAQGWIELGNHLEANEELEQIAASLRSHPDVLELRFQIYAAEEKWEACMDIAAALVKLAPKRPVGWIYRASALHELKRTVQARDELLPAARKFPKDWLVRYNLARYACRLCKLAEARVWLGQAFELGDPKKLKIMALEEADLEMIWQGF